MNMKRRVLSLTIIASLVIGISCKDDEAAATANLYTRLGKTEGISSVVDQFLTNVAADNNINSRFAATVADNNKFMALRTNLINQICAGSGGPCTYTGKTMVAAHTGMNITEAEFNSLVGDLVAALNSKSVPEKEKGELLAVLGPMKTDIVGK
jgi:hemoglobin